MRTAMSRHALAPANRGSPTREPVHHESPAKRTATRNHQLSSPQNATATSEAATES